MTVNVLMSTYNGERFLREQLDSILKQEKVEVLINVRDDGSTDGTQTILQSYGNHLRWVQGKNLGPARSFLQLLKESRIANYYAFSDQDDYWHKDKLAVAIKHLENHNDAPALYFSRTQLTDAVLNPTTVVQINPLLTFGESLIYEFVPGCTIVMNRKMRNIINKYTPSYLPMHDVWIYSVALAVGAKVVFDKTPHILYRQHDNNTIGQGYSMWHEWKRRWQRISTMEQSRYRRAKEISQGFATLMDEENKQILYNFIEAKHNLAKRLSLIHDKRYLCGDKATKTRFNLAVLLNTY